MTDSNSFEWFDIQADSDQWNSYVRQTGQSVFHNSSVLEAHRFGKDQAIGILVRRSGRVVLVFGGLIGKTEGQTSFSTLSFLASERSKDTLVDPLVGWLLAQSISVITLGSYGGGVEACKFAQDQYQRTVRLEFIYDLTVSEEQRFARLANNHRRQLKGLESDAVRLIEIKNHPALVLTKLRQEWRSRKGWERSWLGVAKSYLYHDYLLRTLQRGECGKLYGLQDGKDRKSVV